MIYPPRFLFLEVNQRCNLRCLHCEFWRRDDSDKANYLSRDLKQQVVQDFAQMSPYGTVVICGGEPMLDSVEYFDICRDSRQNGLRINSVVNGTRIRSAKMADRMVLEGPHEISISLNSHIKAEHDLSRGVSGAFDKAVKALRLLLEARARHPESDVRVYVMGLISKSNYRDIADFYDFVLNDIGADKLKLNFIQPSFGRSEKIDPFFAEETDVDAGTLSEIIEGCGSRFELKYNPEWQENVSMYFKSLKDISDLELGWGSRSGTKELICNSYDRNIMVSQYGVARLCFSTAFNGMQLEKQGDLKRFWDAGFETRLKMSKCKQFCGISHSVRAESTTVAGRQKAKAFKENTQAAFPGQKFSGAKYGIWQKLSHRVLG